MKNFGVLFASIVILLSQKTSAQDNNAYAKGKNDTIRVALTMVDDEMIPWVTIPEVVITGKRLFKNDLERAKFNRLR